MKTTRFFLFFFLLISSIHVHAQLNTCDIRTFFTSTSMLSSVFYVPSVPGYQVDSVYWNYGDGVTEKKYAPSINGAHIYANPGTYYVTMEHWGSNFPSNTETFHCTYMDTNFVFSNPTDSLCGGDFKITYKHDTVVFSNTSLIHAPSFNSHPLHLNADWDFGNGSLSPNTLNDTYPIVYAPGTYNVCLYYSGFSFNNGGYLYNCETCKKVTVSPTSIYDIELSEFYLYPNPASTQLTLQSKIDTHQLSFDIVDITGKSHSIHSFATSQYHQNFDISNLSKGYYFLKIYNQFGSKTLVFTVD